MSHYDFDDVGSNQNTDVEVIDINQFDRSTHLGQKRENTRTQLALGMILLVGLIILGIYVGLVGLGWDIDKAESVSMIFLNPILAIFGTIIGFYFASSQS